MDNTTCDLIAAYRSHAKAYEDAAGDDRVAWQGAQTRLNATYDRIVAAATRGCEDAQAFLTEISPGWQWSEVG